MFRKFQISLFIFIICGTAICPPRSASHIIAQQRIMNNLLKIKSILCIRQFQRDIFQSPIWTVRVTYVLMLPKVNWAQSHQHSPPRIAPFSVDFYEQKSGIPILIHSLFTLRKAIKQGKTQSDNGTYFPKTNNVALFAAYLQRDRICPQDFFNMFFYANKSNKQHLPTQTVYSRPHSANISGTVVRRLPPTQQLRKTLLHYFLAPSYSISLKGQPANKVYMHTEFFCVCVRRDTLTFCLRVKAYGYVSVRSWRFVW